MQKCLSIIDMQGCIERYPGGFWTMPGLDADKFGVPIGMEYVAKGTIEALAKRKIIEPCGTRTTKYGPMVFRYKRVDGSNDSMPTQQDIVS